jgi:hypothetical protein
MNESFSSRPTQAKVTMESEDSLKEKGYLKIGEISIKDVIKTCWGADCSSYTCQMKSIQNDFTKQLMKKSASYGGDLLTLHTDKTLQNSSTSKQGECLYWAEIDGMYTEVNERTGQSEIKVGKVNQCYKYDYIAGRECAIVSSGTVWRKESPESINLATAKCLFNRMKEKYSTGHRDVDLRTLDKADRIKVDGKYGFKDIDGNIIVKPQFTAAHLNFSVREGLVGVAIGGKDDTLWGFIDRSGKWVIRPAYQEVRPFHDGLAAVKVNDKWGYIDTKERLIIEPLFDAAYMFIDGLGKIQLNNKEGYINKDGTLYLEP